MEDQALYQLALARTGGIGPVYTKKLIELFGDARSVFHADRSTLERTGLPHNVITAIREFSDYPSLQNELLHLRNIHARTLFFTDPDYPRRLRHLPNAPALLFYQGTANLNAERVIAIVGTRQPTEYGKAMTARLVHELARPDLLILSGLAFGIDAIAHHTALRYHLPTVGVLGHGLDHLYPPEHRSLFHTMRREGGLLTSFFHETGPDSHTFPVRNRLVAGLCDALIVIESSTEGGSLSAAKAALTFGKKVFALPGRVIDLKSQGCLQLIDKGEALPLLSAEQLKAAMGWHWAPNHNSHQPALPFSPAESAEPTEPTECSERSELIERSEPTGLTEPAEPALPAKPTGTAEPAKPAAPATPTSPQHRQSAPALPPHPGPAPHQRTTGKQSPLETKLINLLTIKQPRTFEEFINNTRQPVPRISVSLLSLELKGIIRSLPGKRYLLVP